MPGYVANTDFDWFSFLAQRAPLDEVNFWQPSGGKNRFLVLQPGEPFFFRLKEPHHAIGGFGWFARHERNVRSSLAWEAFGFANGAPSLAEMRARIEKYNRKVIPGRDHAVGCLMISQPVFFPKSQWVEQPNDWKSNNVVGKGYDLERGEGRRILEECLARATRTDAQQPIALAEAPARYGTPTLIRPRLGQGTFRIALNGAYEGACAVTNEHSLPVLEAAHIRPYGQGGDHAVENGLLLRADIHKLFDTGYVTITPDYRFVVSRRLREDWENGRAYYKRDGVAIRPPQRPEDRPSAARLIWHNENIFLG